MATTFDTETIDKLRKLPPREAFEQARTVVFASGPVGSEDFLDVYRQLVDEGVLSWEQVEEFDR